MVNTLVVHTLTSTEYRKEKPDEVAPMIPHKPDLLETDERRVTVLDKLQLLRKSTMQM
jgi:hypothetical protein